MDNLNRGALPPDMDAYPPQQDGVRPSFLGGLPPELMKLIVDQMPIESVTQLASSNTAIWQTYTARSGNVPYAPISAIREAVQSEYDVDKIVYALGVIGKEPLMVQPQLMRALAERAPGLAWIGDKHDCTEWVTLLTGVEDALAAAHGADWRGRQLRDLRIAGVHARFLPFESSLVSASLGRELMRCMYDFPMDMWGDFIDAADAMDTVVPSENKKTFLNALTNVTELSRPASDKFARFIGQALLNAPGILDPVRRLENCGITKTQIEDVIFPSLAVPLLWKIADQRQTIKAGCERWAPYADLLASKVEDAIYLLPITTVRFFDVSMQRAKTDVDQQRLNEKQAATIRDLERDTIDALGKDQSSIDAFPAHWQFSNKMVLTVEEWVKKFDLLTSEAIPLVCQPALLDCWAIALSKKVNRRAEMEAHAGGVFASMHTALTLPALQSAPKLLGRLYAALVNALEAGISTPSNETIIAQKQLVAEQFDKVPPAGWGPMLDLISRHGGALKPLEYATYVNTFINDPNASTGPQRSFTGVICNAAAKSWESLPDQADGTRSKFDVFCDRFTLSERARASAKKGILNGIVARAASGEYTLSEGLRRGGFDADPAARRFARQAYEHRPGTYVAPTAPGTTPDDGPLLSV